MKQKAQVTVFVLIGCIVLAVFLAVGLFVHSFTSDESQVARQQVYDATDFAGEIQHYIQTCVNRVTTQGLRDIASQGGYYRLPDLADGSLRIPYYYLDEMLIPSVSVVENHISLYVADKLRECADLTPFEERGYTFKEGVLEVTTSLQNNSAMIRISYPLDITLGDNTKQLQWYESLISTRLMLLLDVSRVFVEDIHAKGVNQVGINLGLLFDTGNEHDLLFEVSPVGEDTYVSIIDPVTVLDNGMQTVNFIVRYPYE